MNIVPVNNNNNVSMQGTPNAWKKFKKRVCQKILDTLPSATYDDTKVDMKKLDKINERISRPAENRAIMGVTALLTQPGIDSYNPNADEETRRMSMIKDISKITVGTTVGIIVRSIAYKIVEKMTDINGTTKNSRFLLPTSSKHLTDFAKHSTLLNNYRSALSTGLALLAMCVTNFAIDMPFTLKMTNKLNKISKDYIENQKIKNESKSEVNYEKTA